MSVVDDGVNRIAMARTGMEIREAARKAGATMDPYTALKLVEYNQQELARLRGNPNWTRIFRKER